MDRAGRQKEPRGERIHHNMSSFFNFSLDFGHFRENSMAITPDGKLVLCVSPNIHCRLGLEAIHSEQLVRKRGFDPILKKVTTRILEDSLE